MGKHLGASEDKKYPEPSPPTAEGEERARLAALEAHDYNLHVNNPNVAIHASNYVDGQTGMRGRVMPYLSSFFSKKAAE